MSEYVWEPAGRTCSGGPAPGALALRTVCMARFGVRDAGVYNCRTIAGSKRLSLHAEGRAWDAGVLELGGVQGDELAAWIVAHWLELGVQLVIWNRRQWGGSSGPGWRPYGGDADHRDHLHIELTRHAAATLTMARVRALLDGGVSVTEQLTPVELQQFRDLLRSWGPFVEAVLYNWKHGRDPSLWEVLNGLASRRADPAPSLGGGSSSSRSSSAT